MFNQDKFNQLNEKIKYTADGQSSIYMSNQYFGILKDLSDKKIIKSSKYIPFVYAFMYFQTYMFRYSKYEKFTPTTGEVKEILGYSPKQQTVDYLIKKDGVLDTYKLTQTIYDFPILHSFNTDDKTVSFDMLSDFDKDYSTKWRKEKNINSKMSCKYPTLAFYDELNNFDGVTFIHEGGSFSAMENTTKIDFDIFNFCMANDEIGVTGFYIYSYIKHKNDLFSSFDCSIQRFSNELGLSDNTVKKYLKAIREYNLVTTIQADHFIIGGDKEDFKANTHISNEFADFTTEKMTISKPNFITNEKYKRIKECKFNVDELF